MRTVLFSALMLICMVSAAQPGLKWAGQIGGNGYCRLTGCAADSKGNTYVCGTVKDSADLDPGAGTHKVFAYSHAAVVIKIDSSGNRIWSKMLSGDSEIAAIDVDQNGNVYAFGGFSGSINLNPGGMSYYLNGGNELFLCKWNANGNFIWGQKIGNAFYEYAVAMQIDGASNIVFTGSFRDTLDLDPGTGKYLLASNGGSDVFVSTFNSSGYLISAQSFGSVYNDYPTDLALGNDGSVYLCGRIGGTADMDPGSEQYLLTSSGSSFISKLDQQRNFKWAHKMAGSYYGGELTSDTAANVYYGSEFNSSIDADPGPGTQTIVSSGLSDGFVVKFDSHGNFIRSAVFGGSSYDGLYDVATDGFGSLYITGYFFSEMDADPGNNIFSLSNELSIYLVKLDSAGDFACAGMLRGVNNIGYQKSYFSITGSSVMLCGNFWGTTDFDPGDSEYTMTDEWNNSDMFITKLTPGSCCVESVEPSQILGADKLCSGDAAELSVSGGKLGDAAIWKWYEGSCGNGTPVASGGKVSFSPKKNTTYYVRAEGMCNTTACFPLSFILDQKPEASVSAVSNDAAGLSAGLVASGGISYSWFPSAQVDCDSCSSVSVFQDETTTYCAIATAQNGCRDTACITVTLTSVFVPNAFTPNDDDVNDVFKPVVSGVSEYTLSVFNRWGDKVFETSDTDSEWSGKYKGNLCEAGIYCYFIRYTSSEDKKDHEKTGKVLLIR